VCNQALGPQMDSDDSEPFVMQRFRRPRTRPSHARCRGNVGADADHVYGRYSSAPPCKGTHSATGDLMASSSPLTHRHGRRVHAHSILGVTGTFLHRVPRARSPNLRRLRRRVARTRAPMTRRSPRIVATGTRALARPRRSLDCPLARRPEGGVAQPWAARRCCARAGVIFVLSNSVTLLADLIHNCGDALTAVPLGIACFLLPPKLSRREPCGAGRRIGDPRLTLRGALRNDPTPAALDSRSPAREH
jgi:hypothetical protein